MLERIKRAARDKLMNAVREAHDPQVEQLRTALEASRQRVDELGHQVAELHREVVASEIRQRRDLMAAGERAAVATSAAYVAEHFLEAHPLPFPHDTLRHVLALAPTGGLALELGVASGTTLGIIAEARDETVYGFDVFTGLPESWRPGFPEGMFAQEELPQVEGAELVVGLFEDTLPGFLDEHEGPIDFLHVDCDLYSATVTALEVLGPRLQPGSIVLFDEYFNHQNWESGEAKAWAEHVERYGLTYTYVAYTIDNEQVAVRIDSVGDATQD